MKNLLLASESNRSSLAKGGYFRKEGEAQIYNWKSSLVLTEEERNVIETRGTVLLLGRSGTGKH